jgi:hypothetical protein
MGHKINPQIYRLGTSVDWKYQLRDPLLANIFIYRLVRSLVFQYSAPYTTFNVGRKTNITHQHSFDSLIRVKSGQSLKQNLVLDMIAGKKKMIQNPFLDKSFVFSHLNISYSPSLFISIFLLDGAAERKRIKRKLPERYFYYLSGKVRKRSRRWCAYFRTYMFMRKRFKKGRRALLSRYYYRIRNFTNSRLFIRRTAKRAKIKNRSRKKKKSKYSQVRHIPFRVETVQPYRKAYLLNALKRLSIWNPTRLSRINKKKGLKKILYRNPSLYLKVCSKKKHSQRFRKFRVIRVISKKYNVSTGILKKARKYRKTISRRAKIISSKNISKTISSSLFDVESFLPRKRYRRYRIYTYRKYSHRLRRKVIKLTRYNIIAKKRFPIWFANFMPIIYYKRTSYNILKNLKILKFLLRYFKYYNQVLSKKRLLFFHLLISTLSSLITLLPKGVFTNRLFVFLHLCYMYLYCFKYLHFQYNKSIYQLRFIRYNLLSKFVLFSLKKVSFISTDNKLILRYYGMHNRSFNAQFFLNFILHKLGQYFRLNAILNPILNRLNRLSVVKGYRFIVSGRLTRKERAAFIVRSARAMPLSTKSVRIDAAQDFRIMKFGIVGIKIYLLYDKTPPYYYLFEFRNKL